LSFRLQTAIDGKPVAAIFDSSSIFIGGLVFLIATTNGVFKIILSVYLQKETPAFQGDNE
jgi:hypothetical protein